MAEKRTKKLTVRMTEREWEKAQGLAHKSGRPLAVLMREWAIGKEKALRCKPQQQVVVHSADPELLRHIAKISGNVNQVARHLNRLNKERALSRADMIEAIATLKAIEDDLSLLAFTHDY